MGEWKDVAILAIKVCAGIAVLYIVVIALWMGFIAKIIKKGL